MPKTNQVYEGEYVDVTNGTITACCDCGLVHVVNYKVVDGRILRMLFVDTVRTRNRRKTKCIQESIKRIK